MTARSRLAACLAICCATAALPAQAAPRYTLIQSDPVPHALWAEVSHRSSAVSANGRYVAYLASIDRSYRDETEAARHPEDYVARDVALLCPLVDPVAPPGTCDGVLPGNRYGQVVLMDRKTGAATLVTHAPDGKPGDGDSDEITMSDDGRWVAFMSYAKNLLPGRNGSALGGPHAYLYDTQSKRLRRVDVDVRGDGLAGAYSVRITGDGATLFMKAPGDVMRVGGAWETGHLYSIDRRTGRIALVRTNTGHLMDPSQYDVTPDGRYFVAAHGYDADSDRWLRVAVYDRRTGRLRYLADYSGSSDVQPRIGGRFVVFREPKQVDSSAPNNRGEADHLVIVDFTTRRKFAADELSPPASTSNYAVSGDGQWLFYTSSWLGVPGLYKVKLGGELGKPELVSGTPARTPCTDVGCVRPTITGPASSLTGAYLAFLTDAPLDARDDDGDSDLYLRG